MSAMQRKLCIIIIIIIIQTVYTLQHDSADTGSLPKRLFNIAN
jgi:hypothetical protein